MNNAVSDVTPSAATTGRTETSGRPPNRRHVPWERIEVVLVSYRSRRHVEALLDLWPAQLPVVVVDNAQGADDLEGVVARRPGARYLVGGGQGFARAANLGAATSGADYVVFVNPDSRPTAADLLALVEGLDADPISASHAATMTGADGEVEIGVGGWEPTPLRTAAFAFGLHKRWPTAGVYAGPRLGERRPVQWTTGACMAVRLAQFRRLGGFDESFYVYSEDMSFGRRARGAGLRQVLRPDVVVRHGAAGSGAPSLEMLRLRGASFANYVVRYHSPVSAGLMRAMLAAGYSLRAVQRRLRNERSLSAQYSALVRGVLTREAFVGGQEVARARIEETAVEGHR